MLIIDSAQIEARILAWLAGQQDLLDGFARGEDVYSTFATKLFRTTVRKLYDDDPEPVKRTMKIRRGFGKDATLGCGYGMGAKKFYERCLQNVDLRPLFDSGEYDFEFIQKLIKTYRKTYNCVPILWKNIENSFKWVIRYPHQTMACEKFGEYFVPKIYQAIQPKLWFWNESGTVRIQLPSTRILYYRHCRIAEADGYSTIQWQWGHTWGGPLVENIVQAIARDLLGYWILEFEKAGIHVMLHAHDEIVAKASSDNSVLQSAAKSLAYDIMCHSPDWAEGLPLNAEGIISDVYTK